MLLWESLVRSVVTSPDISGPASRPVLKWLAARLNCWVRRKRLLLIWLRICWGKNRTAFILKNAARSAEGLLAEKTHFHRSADQWDAFQAALDAPIPENIALKRLLGAPPTWHYGKVADELPPKLPPLSPMTWRGFVAESRPGIRGYAPRR